jgi:hypothetical protein
VCACGQPGSVDYHAAMAELLLHGLNVGGDAKHFSPPMRAAGKKMADEQL